NQSRSPIKARAARPCARCVQTITRLKEYSRAVREGMGNTQQAERREGCDVYQIITDRIINLLEQGTVPWHKAWSSDDRLPMNLCSGKPYRGINVFLLHVTGYGSPYWLTLKQANERGGHIRKGE